MKWIKDVDDFVVENEAGERWRGWDLWALMKYAAKGKYFWVFRVVREEKFLRLAWWGDLSEVMRFWREHLDVSSFRRV